MGRGAQAQANLLYGRRNGTTRRTSNDEPASERPPWPGVSALDAQTCLELLKRAGREEVMTWPRGSKSQRILLDTVAPGGGVRYITVGRVRERLPGPDARYKDRLALSAVLVTRHCEKILKVVERVDFGDDLEAAIAYISATDAERWPEPDQFERRQRLYERIHSWDIARYLGLAAASCNEGWYETELGKRLRRGQL